MSKDGGEDATIRHPGAHLGRIETRGPDDVDGCGQQLGVGEHIRFAEDVEVELEVLSQPTALFTLVAE